MRTLLALGGLAMAVAGVPVAVPVSAEATAAECQGKPATIVQAEGTVQGTDGDDVVVAGLDTHVRARAGNDTICTLGGLVEGGAGTDSVEMIGTDDADAVDLRDVEVINVALGLGIDHAHLSWSEPTAVSGTVDAGPKRELDQLTVIGTDTVRVDLAAGRIEVEGDSIAATGFSRALAAATRVWLSGDGHDNGLIADACRMNVRGLGGRDQLRISTRYRTPQTCHRPVVRRLVGGRGNDLVLGGVGNDVLLGGPGRDRANGRAGADICRAEIERECER